MMISKKLAAAINEQIGHELQASHQYYLIAAYFDNLALKNLSGMFFRQGNEEHEHAMKFAKYVVEAGGDLAIPAIPAPQYAFKTVEEAVQKSVDWEWEVTRRINALMDIAREEKDYLGQGFLQWFIDEQLEEVSTMETLLRVVKQVEKHNIFLLESFAAHAD